MSENIFLKKKHVFSRYNVIMALMQDRSIKTIQDLADKIGSSRPTLSLIIHEHKEPSEDFKIRLAKALNVDSRIIFPVKEVQDECR
jgi:transcriptional regulator with XRE-family HTH domain